MTNTVGAWHRGDPPHGRGPAVKAAPLPDNGTIGVPAPSSPYDERSEIDRGVRWWESRGYRVKLGGGIYERDDYVAGVEDVHCPPWYVDGMLVQLRNARKLENVVGMAIGQFHQPAAKNEPEPWLRSRSLEDVFERHLEPLGVPIVFNLPLGHGEHLWTLPLGVTATVDADARTLTIDDTALERAPAATGHALDKISAQ